MKIPPFKLAHLLHGHMSEKESFDLITVNVEEVQDDDPQIGKPLSFGVEFLRLADRVHANFSDIETEVTVACNRCLKQFSTKIYSKEASYDYMIETEESSAEERADNFMADMKNNIVDVSEALRNEILLASPDFPLCQEDCQGICSICGKNKNEKPACTCNITVISEEKQENTKALAGLKDLVTKTTKSKK